jgi:hypothetical protein
VKPYLNEKNYGFCHPSYSGKHKSEDVVQLDLGKKQDTISKIIKAGPRCQIVNRLWNPELSKV